MICQKDSVYLTFSQFLHESWSCTLRVNLVFLLPVLFIVNYLPMLFFYINFSGEQGYWNVIPLVLFIFPALLNEFYSTNVVLEPYLAFEKVSHFSLSFFLLGVFIFVLAYFLSRRFRTFCYRISAKIKDSVFHILSRISQGAYALQRPNQRNNVDIRNAQEQKLEKVALMLQKLPTEEHCDEVTLRYLSVHDLKERLKARGVSSEKYLEKSDMIKTLLEDGGSSASSCSICCEDYETGDVLRLLPCHHRFHIECIDKWLFTMTDYSRQVACPLCNSPFANQ